MSTLPPQPTDDEATIVVDTPRAAAPAIQGYEILRTLGKGGMGHVYLARQLDVLDREVALKTTLPVADDALFRSYFLKEGHRQAQLHHPNILPIYAAGESGDLLYLSMLYARNGSLRDRIDNAALETDQIIDIVCSVLSALDHAHHDLEAPLAHLDVKPENILFDGDSVYLADFGIARTFAQDATVIGGAAGDPRYWSPEQQINEASTKSDIYALGVTFHETLTGERPAPELRTITSAGQSKALTQSMPTSGRKFAAVIARCLHPDPDCRPEAAEIRDELRALQRPKTLNKRLIGAVVALAIIGVLAAQPGLRMTAQEAWQAAFPPDAYPVQFEISPNTGRLWIDGQEEALRNLPVAEGEHRIVAVASGYVGEARLIDVTENPATVSFVLQPIPAVSDEEYRRFVQSFDGSARAHQMNWADPTIQGLVTLDQLAEGNPARFETEVGRLTALSNAGDAVATTTLFYAAFEGLAIPGGPKPLAESLAGASEDGYAIASMLRALYVLQSLLEAGQTFNDNAFAFKEVTELLERAALQGLPDSAALVAGVAGIPDFSPSAPSPQSP